MSKRGSAPLMAGGEIRTPEPLAVVSAELAPLAERTTEEAVRERKEGERPWNGCPSCWLGLGGIAKVTSTRGAIRYMKCQACGWTYKVQAPPATSIQGR